VSGNQIASLSSLVARKATFLLALILIASPKMDFVGEQIEYRYECPVCEAKMMVTQPVGQRSP
jgi:hypothetical protein